MMNRRRRLRRCARFRAALIHSLAISVVFGWIALILWLAAIGRHGASMSVMLIPLLISGAAVLYFIFLDLLGSHP